MKQHAYTTTGVVIASAVLGALALAAFVQRVAEALNDLFSEDEPVVIDTARNGGVSSAWSGTSQTR